jgi:hypothetical protein
VEKSPRRYCQPSARLHCRTVLVFSTFPSFLSCFEKRHLEDGILFSVSIKYHYAAEGNASMLTTSTHLPHTPRPCKFGANSLLVRHVHTHNYLKLWAREKKLSALRLLVISANMVSFVLHRSQGSF